jgi:multidrug efflux pump subunit AcrB
MVITVLFGLKQFFNFPRQEDPPITIREVVVSAIFPGMEPMDVEQLITRKLEAQIRTLPEMDDIWSDNGRYQARVTPRHIRPIYKR